MTKTFLETLDTGHWTAFTILIIEIVSHVCLVSQDRCMSLAWQDGQLDQRGRLLTVFFPATQKHYLPGLSFIQAYKKHFLTFIPIEIFLVMYAHLKGIRI